MKRKMNSLSIWHLVRPVTSDGYKPYLEAFEGAFGADTDYAMLVKLNGEPVGPKGHDHNYSPSKCIVLKKSRFEGEPNEVHISTSYFERQYLPKRKEIRRFTRWTNTFSKKLGNHVHMLSLYFVHCNLCRISKSLRMSPAMAASVTGMMKDMERII